MTTRDYDIIASVIYHCDDITDEAAIVIAKAFAIALKEENPRFDEDRFFIASLGERP